MEREELLKALRRQEVMDNLRCLGCGHQHQCSTKGCAVNRAAAELIEQLTAENEALRHPPNPPLTLEELREMDGEPVWLDFGDDGEWVLVRIQQGKVFFTHQNTICAPAIILLACGGKCYRHKPERDVSKLDTSQGEEGQHGA